MAQATIYRYITRDENILGGEPIIEGTHTPVRAIVEKWRMGTPPEEIPIGLPHLTVAQVFAALAYFSDHKDEINEYIVRNRIPDHLIGTMVSGEELARARREGRPPQGKPLKSASSASGQGGDSESSSA